MSLIGGAIMGGASYASARQTNKAMMDLADTRYQRTVADMKKAGLNPILAAGGGSTAGSTPQLQNPTEGAVKGIMDTANTAANVKMKKVLGEKAVADTDNAIKTGELIDLQKGKLAADTRYVDANTAAVVADTHKKETQGSLWDIAGDAVKWGKGVVSDINSALSHRVPDSRTGGKMMGTVDDRKPLDIKMDLKKNAKGDWTAKNPDGTWNNGAPAR